MEEKINKIFADSIDKLKLSQSKNSKVERVIITKDFFDEDYRKLFKDNFKTDYLLNQINKIANIKEPVLYWFEFDEAKTSKETVRNKFIGYKDLCGKQYDHPAYRYTSSLKKINYEMKNILYVGKVEKGFLQRIKTHLGYATSNRTAGMQLQYWYDIENYGDLTLYYITFNDEMKYLITILEKELAIHLNPLIGKY